VVYLLQGSNLPQLQDTPLHVVLMGDPCFRDWRRFVFKER